MSFLSKKNQKKLLSLVILLVVGLFYFFSTTEWKKSFSNPISPKEPIEQTINVDSTDLLSVSFIDVGQADSILVKEKDKNILIDAGNNVDGPKLVSYLKSLGIASFDYVIATHPHEDHIGGMDDIINNFTIHNFYMPDAITTTKTFEDVLDALESKNIAAHIPTKNETFTLDQTQAKVLYVGSDERDLNNTSIVLKLEFNNISFLLMGDASKKVEEQLDSKNLKSDVLKVGHHGSKTSTSKEFLEAVNPKYAVISVGKENNYHHPSSPTLKSLANKNITVYRTDEDGTITMLTDGTNIEIKTGKTDTNG